MTVGRRTSASRVTKLPLAGETALLPDEGFCEGLLSPMMLPPSDRPSAAPSGSSACAGAADNKSRGSRGSNRKEDVTRDP